MTDFPTPRSRLSADPAGITTRPEPPDVLEALRGRLLLQVNPVRVSRHLDHVFTSHSGLILSGGERTSEKAYQLRQDGYSGVVLADPALYLKDAATQDDPFLSPGNQASTFGALEDALSTQLARGATAAMSPTGYIHAEDFGALKAAAADITGLDDPRMIFAVPLSVAWLHNDPVRQLIAVLQTVPGAKAIMLGGQMDPLARQRTIAVANLCKVIAEVPDTALIRTDIAAFGALAHGAVFSAFGMGSAQRHIVPPPEKPKSSKGGGNSPAVLYPDLMSFFLGEKIAKHFAAVADAPTCTCAICGGRALDRFTSRDTEKEAIGHNVAVMMGWKAQLEAATAHSDPRRWWRGQCSAAVDRYTEINTRIKQPNGFQVPAQLAQWATNTLTDDTAPHDPR